MLGIALCGDMPLSHDEAARALREEARDLGAPDPQVMSFATALELLERVDSPATEPLIDLIVLGKDSGTAMGQAVRDARKAGYAGAFCLVGVDAAQALEGRRLQVESCVARTDSANEAERELRRLVRQLVRQDAESIVLRLRSGLTRIPFPLFVYAQTESHDQVIHLLDGSTRQLRCSSQDLFDRLSHDSRFLKMGSSYIVNLDLARALYNGGGTLHFVEGSSATVPVRFRKQVQGALLARHGGGNQGSGDERISA